MYLIPTDSKYLESSCMAQPKPRQIRVGDLLAWSDDPIAPLRVVDILLAEGEVTQVLLDDGRAVVAYPLADIFARTVPHAKRRQRVKHTRPNRTIASISTVGLRPFQADDTEGDTVPILGRISPAMSDWIKSLGHNRSFHVRQALKHYRESGHYKQFEDNADEN
jgi:hypothetical protein